MTSKIFKLLKMRTLQFRPLTTMVLHCLEKSVFGYPLTQRRIPEARKRPNTRYACLFNLILGCRLFSGSSPMSMERYGLRRLKE